MTNPNLWGPAMWQALFACAWRGADDARLTDLLLRLVPLLLPCRKCRNHFVKNRPAVARRAHGEPSTSEHAFRWLWFLKDQVNKGLGMRSVALEDLRQRYAVHGAVVDEVLLGDALVFVALEARVLERDDLFVELCAALAALLPLPDDSQFGRALEAVTRPVVPAARAAARAARVERGHPVASLAHYQAVAD